jgi:hypothetical protein
MDAERHNKERKMKYLNHENWMESQERFECVCPCGQDLGMHPCPEQSGPYCGDEECAEYLEDHPDWYAADAEED